MPSIENMTKDELLIFLADSLLMRASVTGEIKFGTNDETIDEFKSRARAGNDSFQDVIDRVSELTGKQTEADPRDVRAAERKRKASKAAARRLAAANAEIARLEGGAK